MASRRPYKLDPEPLGIGGCGIVHRAVSRENGQVVALKKALPGAASLARMKREIEVQQSMHHPNVMPILDADPKSHWFTMPLAETTFRHRYQSTVPSDLTLARTLLEVAAGLQYAHNLGHVHRDATPSNILYVRLPEGARWVVADWGLVQKPEGQDSLPLTITGQVLGTQAFGPPELMTAPHGVGPEVDVYYVGALIAWALTGEQPSHTAMPQPKDERWASLVSRSTQSDPLDRPQSMVDVLATLHELRDGFQREYTEQLAVQDGLFADAPCGVCGSQVTDMRCGKCGSYYANYN